MSKKVKCEYASVKSAALLGIDGEIVEIECQQSLQVPTFSIVGLPVKSARDARERVLSALFASGLSFPSRRIVLNVCPASLGSEDDRSYDLPIAIACLVAAGKVRDSDLKDAIFMGELTLRGEIKPVRSALALHSLHRRGLFQKAYVAIQNVDSIPEGVSGGAFRDLGSLVKGINLGNLGKFPGPKKLCIPSEDSDASYWSLICGQSRAKRMLEIAAAGEHHALFMGPMGAGKTTLANSLPSILPPLGLKEREESQAVYAVRNLSWLGRRPMRAPHPSITPKALLGGGSSCLPGELSLAHAGVLFMDEMFEASREVLESLRTVLEEGEVRLARGQREARLPARFNFIGAANLCPCGSLGSRFGECRCGEEKIENHHRKMSGALLDRIDLRWCFGWEDRHGEEPSLVSVRTAVAKARKRMVLRQGFPNGRLRGKEARSALLWSKEALQVMESVREGVTASFRSSAAVLRVALTITDLREGGEVSIEDVNEALSFRRDPRTGFQDGSRIAGNSIKASREHLLGF